MTKPEKWRLVLMVVAITAPLGTLIGMLIGFAVGGSSVRSLSAGAAIGLLITMGMVTFDTSWAVGLIPERWREANFATVLLTRSLAWLAITFVSISLPLLTIARVEWGELVDTVFVIAVVVSFLVALLFNFIGQVNRLLGRGVLVGLILGRYHRPREEVRIFLFIDLRGSTALAERLGNVEFHTFVRRFIADVTAGALRHGAEIHRYVGDEVILTWKEKKGLADASCIRAVFAVRDAIDVKHRDYLAAFGAVPEFWAGLHLGPVVTGDVGTAKHQIVFLGDTINTTARIEEACRRFQAPFLVSADILARLELPGAFEATSVGPVELRGVADPVELFAVNHVDEAAVLHPPIRG